MIIETSSNELYRVRETGDADLAHVWHGTAVKRVAQKAAHIPGTADRFRIVYDYIPKAKAREVLVRKAGSRVVSSDA